MHLQKAPHPLLKDLKTSIGRQSEKVYRLYLWYPGLRFDARPDRTSSVGKVQIIVSLASQAPKEGHISHYGCELKRRMACM